MYSATNEKKKKNKGKKNDALCNYTHTLCTGIIYIARTLVTIIIIIIVIVIARRRCDPRFNFRSRVSIVETKQMIVYRYCSC